LYFLLGFIVIVSSLVYWKREALKKEISKFKLKEVSVGPAKFEAKDNSAKSSDAGGVSFGTKNDFTQAEIEDVVGGDRSLSTETKPGQSSVGFGNENTFKEAKIKNITGGSSGNSTKSS